MIHIFFNYHDPLVQLRLRALLGACLILVCLALLEFRQRPSARLRACCAVMITAGVVLLAQGLVALHGA